mmetsp:Transcript_40985/g.68083  ORF Transcript_40985/g.68083 Transcript_40985/m.68083 type:complete len:86 (-) Transcript_40985:156-413(-)
MEAFVEELFTVIELSQAPTDEQYFGGDEMDWRKRFLSSHACDLRNHVRIRATEIIPNEQRYACELASNKAVSKCGSPLAMVEEFK